MKFAFISDIHANVQALSATLEHIKQQDIDKLFVLGDVATLGPNPKEVIELLAEQQAIFIRGNHDDLLINLASRNDLDNVPLTYQWTKKQLSQEHIEILKAYQKSFSIKLQNDNTMLVFHAAPWDNEASLRDIASCPKLQDKLKKYKEQFYVGGHDHQQYHLRLHKKTIVNVGSVGFPYQQVPFSGLPRAFPWSEYALAQETDTGLDFTFTKVEYDLNELRHAAIQSGNPLEEWLTSIQ